MNRVIYSIVLSLTFWIAGIGQAWAISQPLHFQEMPLNPKLTSNMINTIAQDDRGLLYFGTATGLCRYDGYEIVPFRQTGGKDNYIKRIVPHQGHLWLLTGDGWEAFDPIAEKVLEDTTGMAVPPIVTMARDKRWNDVTDVLDLGNNRLVVITNTPRVLVADSDNLKVEKSIDTPFNCAERRVYNLAHGSDSTVWAFGEAGIAVLNLNTMIWSQQWHGVNLAQLPIAKAIITDDEEAVWIAFDHSGLVRITPDGRVTQAQNNPSDPRSLSSNSLTALYQDHSGSVWIGTRKSGMMSYHPARQKFAFHPCPDVNVITSLPDNSVLIGTDAEGLILCNPVAWSQKKITGTLGAPGSCAGVVCLKPTDDGVWIGTYNHGLHLLKPSGQMVQYTQANGLASDNIWDVYPLPGDDLLLATLGGGLQIWNPTTGSKNVWLSNNSPLRTDYIAQIVPDRRNPDLVFLATSGGLANFNLRSHSILAQTGTRDGHQQFSHFNINQVLVDHHNLLWLATYAGLDVYDPQRDLLWHVPLGSATNGGSDPTTDFILGLLEDKQGNIWVSTGSRLIRVTPSLQSGDWTFSSTIFDQQDGLPRCDFNQRSFASLPGGVIAVGGLNGVSSFRPSEITAQEAAPSYIIDLTLRKGNLGPIDGQRLVDGVKIAYSENEFTVTFAADDYANPSATVWLYRLTGYQDEWIATQPGDNHATYTNLGSGHYTFEVKTLLPDGTEGLVTALPITIASPWWASWWAIIIYICLILGAVALIIRTARRRERTHALETQYQEQSRLLGLVDNLLNDKPVEETVNPAPVLMASDYDRLHERVKDLLQLRQEGDKQPQYINPEPTPLVITSVDEQLIQKAVKHVENNMDNPDLSVEELASHLGMSRVHLYKRIKHITGKTPIEFIRTLRLKRAAQLLRESQMNVSEIAYQCGFNAPKAFSKYFREEFGVNPSVYQESHETTTNQPLVGNILSH